MELSKEQFKEALSAKGVLTEKRQQFLIILARSPSQSATADQMAGRLGYRDKVTANGLIGRFSRAVANYHNIEMFYENRDLWPLVAHGANGKDGFYWTMKKNLYDALCELNIVYEGETIALENSSLD